MSRATLQPPVSERDHAQGSATALVTLVEYGDYECPHCGRAYPIIRAVQRQLGERLRFVFRNFPLTEAHPHAPHAAEAAESVAAHGGAEAFWRMHDLLYEQQRAGLDDAALGRLATQAGVEAATVQADLEVERRVERVQDDFMSGVRSGVNGTPTFFIDGVRYDGSWEEEPLVSALERAARRASR